MTVTLQDKREIALAASRPRNDVQYSWLDNPDVQKLLDVIASIIADEYIQIAKQNPDTFSNTGGPK
ncbi:MAG: hypothetical protein KJ957_07985 [Candidatus Omnitrophica bacterium]|nr:hypothetical protein [Candidatus Omnitrophota bacterium]MBU1853967.1 hypothetical protein [Candidatus Omnitrophota bacterium]